VTLVSHHQLRDDPFYMDKDANAKEFNFARLSDLKLPVTFRM